MTDKYDAVILLFCGSGIFGGGDRLFLRMVRWLHVHDYRTMVMYNKSANIVPELLKQLDEGGAERIPIPDIAWSDNIPDFMKAHIELPKNSRVKIISVESEYNFFAAQMMQHNLPDCKFDVVQYVIHQDEFCRFKFSKIKSDLVTSMFREYYRRLVERMERYGSIVYYLKEAAENVYSTLGIKHLEKAPTVIHIGMDLDTFDENSFRNRYHDSSFLIVATARLEFPEKGFLIGLVDEFEAVLAQRPEARLIIVGSGPHSERMKARVAASPAAKAIEMVGNLPYEELVGCINSANLYISNGSGPLDAARSGLAAIVANFFTEECLTTGYWCDAPDNLGYGGSIPVREMILKTMGMSEEEYLVLAHRTYDTFLQYCGMDSFMERMLAKRNVSEKPLLSRKYLLGSKLLRVVMNLGLRLVKQ